MDEIKNKTHLKETSNLKKFINKKIRTKYKTNSNRRIQLNLSKLCTYTRALGERK
jgi:hypothetical protein